MKITASEGKVFKRKSDDFVFGKTIYLGIDYSTGIGVKDSAENYEEIDDPNDDPNDSEDAELTDSEILKILLGNEA